MYLYGASSHAKVIIEILEARGIIVDGLFDDDDSIKSLLKYPVQHFSSLYNLDKNLVISIGNNLVRKKIASSLDIGCAVAIHPASVISGRSSVGEGTVVMGSVTINAGSYIGRHCIINTNASIDHDCILEDFVHISPNVALCGDVNIGEGTLVGAGTVIIPGKKIGKWCTIGAGSVIIKHVPDFLTIAGNPVKIIKSSNSRL